MRCFVAYAYIFKFMESSKKMIKYTKNFKSKKQAASFKEYEFLFQFCLYHLV